MSETGAKQYLIDAYYRMLERLKNSLDSASEKATPVIEQAISQAQEAATELGELSREEAERISQYLRRDIEDAAMFLNESGTELKDWLKFDLQMVEQHLAEIFRDSVDHTRLALTQLAQHANKLGEWRTGEITGIGTLQCKSCGESLNFHRISRIPPCPKCHNTTFRRQSTKQQ
ncbi:MAG: zinc ribbon-containing protein [Thiohalomonadaceae bacterium]|jgi:vacuolar-type H+-ATPase subunit H